jgi:hypothetical protein
MEILYHPFCTFSSLMTIAIILSIILKLSLALSVQVRGWRGG